MKDNRNHKTSSLLAVGILLLALAGYAPGLWAGPQHLPAPASQKGKVVTTMTSGGYIYAELENDGNRTWVATWNPGGEGLVKKGDTVEFFDAALMKEFPSKSLNRTFAEIYFAGRINVNGKPLKKESPKTKGALPKDHIPLEEAAKRRAAGTDNKITVEPGSIKKADKGFTVEECCTLKDLLAGKDVVVRGKVVKFSPNIMDKNWIHLQDGTGSKGTNDLVITTKQEAKVGDTILVKGKMTYDKNFGFGYVYKHIIEDAAITVE